MAVQNQPINVNNSVLKFITINFRLGINDTVKRSTIFQEIRSMKYDILLMQEMGCVSQERFHSWAAELNAVGVISLSPKPNTRGTGILINKNLGAIIQNSHFCINDLGYAVAVDLLLGSRSYRVVSVHFPVTRQASPYYYLEQFTDWLHNVATTDRIFVMGGDFNCVESYLLDSRNKDPAKNKNASFLHDFCTQFSFKDPYRSLYPIKREFTHRQMSSVNNRPILQRLGRFYISNKYLDKIQRIYILPCVLSDHDYVIMDFLTPDVPTERRGPGYWKLNVSILEDPITVDAIETLWNTELKHIDIPDFDWWEQCKNTFKDTLITVSKDFHKSRNQDIKRLKNEIIFYQKMERACFQPELISPIILAKEEEYKELLRYEARGAMIRSRVQDIEEGERPTRYFLNKEKLRMDKKSIKFLQSNGTEYHKTDDMLKIIHEFYSDLYTNRPIDQNIVDEFLTGIDPISDNDKLICEGLMTYDECLQALKLMENNKSPGLDGLPVEFYKKFFYLFGHHLVKLYNAAFIWGQLSPSQRTALMTLLCKKLELHMFLPQWRPISLLTIDYKIISKVMSLRLKQILPNIIHKNQLCSVTGRSIHDGCHLIRNIIDYVQDRPAMGLAILNLDIKKAFDTISYTYIIQVLQAYGFGPEFTQWLHILYNNVNAKVIVNGFFTDPFDITRGVRQGCSLSPLLYVLCVEPLACYIRNDPNITGFHLPGGSQVKLCQYADDITGILHDPSSVNHFLKIVDKFGQASGARLNKDKCSGIWLGKYSNKNSMTTFANLKWEVNAKILGIYVGINNNDEENWVSLIKGIAQHLKTCVYRNLSLKGRAVILNANILSKLWYRATILGIPKQYADKLQVLINKFMWNEKMVLIKTHTLELPHKDGGIQLVNVPLKVQSFKIKHIFQLLYGISSHPWKSLAKYWLGIKLKAMKLFTVVNDWTGPFA